MYIIVWFFSAKGSLYGLRTCVALMPRTMEKLNTWQRSKLVKGTGWQGWQLSRGFYATCWHLIAKQQIWASLGR